MKTKKFKKKLSLGKHTVSDLNSRELYLAKGGAPTVTAACNSCVDTCMTDCDICTELCPPPTDPIICPTSGG